MTDETAHVNGHVEPYVEFDYAEIDRGNPLTAVLEDSVPNKEYRECAEKFLAVIGQVVSFIVAYEHPRFAGYAVACAFGLTPITGGRSMEQIGDELGVDKAAVSKVTKKLQRSFGSTIEGIAPMLGQKSPEACKKYAKSRKRNLV